VEEEGGVEIRHRELAGRPAVDDTDDPMEKEATEACQPSNWRSTITIFDYVGYAPSSLLDAR
jgi:hypothetical protein